MKAIILIAVSVLSLSAFAGQKVGPAGCGLGNQFLGPDDQMLQIFAATLNGTSGNQTFGISSGTSNCVDSRGVATLEAFVEANQVALSNDISRGNGETVATLGSLLSCSNQNEVNSRLKQSYGEIFSEEESAQVSTQIRKVLSSPATGCNVLG